MRLVGAAVGIADAVGERVGGEQAVGFNDPALAVGPGGLDGVEPGALARQVAGDDAHPTTELPDLSVMAAEPVADLVAGVPGGVIPDQQEGVLAGRVELAAAPVQVVDGDGAHGSAVDEPQPDLVR